MTECIFKRGVTCEDFEDDEISGWLIMPATKVVVLVLKYNDNGDGNVKRINKNLVNEAVLTNALKLCKKNNSVWIEHGAPTTAPLLARPRLSCRGVGCGCSHKAFPLRIMTVRVLSDLWKTGCCSLQQLLLPQRIR